MAVCIGAMMGGSINTTMDEGGSVVTRGQEFDYFAFGQLVSGGLIVNVTIARHVWDTASA